MILFLNCTKEALPPTLPPLVLLEKEIVNGFETYTYAYNEGKLNNVIFRQELFDPINNASYIDTEVYSIEYHGDRVDRITESYYQYLFDVEDGNLRICQLRFADTLLQIEFEDFENLNVSTVHIKHSNIVDETIIATVDEHNNIIYATDENNNRIENAYSHLTGKMYSFFGEMEFDDMQNVYSGFPPDIRLWLSWNRNSNNVVKKSLNDKVWLYEYNYNEQGFPVFESRVVHSLVDSSFSEPRIVIYKYVE